MGNIKQAIANEVAMTITLASLANNGARESTAVDNATNLYEDALVQLLTKTGATVNANGYINVYAYASVDGTNYGNGATGSDAGITLQSPPNVKLIGRITANADNTAYKSNPMSVASAFGGRLPEKWGIIIENKTGAGLSSTGGDHVLNYQGMYSQYT